MKVGKESTDVNRKEYNRQVVAALKILVHKYGVKVNDVDRGVSETKVSKLKEELRRALFSYELGRGI
jgi:hypothetical protein